MRLALSVILAAVSTAGTTPVERLGMPPGWLDLSPEAPAENFARAPGNFAEAARASKALQFAVEPASEGVVPAYFDARVVPKALEVSPRALDETAAVFLKSRQTSDPAARLIAKEFVRVREVDAMRVEVEHAIGGRPFRAITYQVPLGSRTAFLSYGCETAGCERVRATISAAVSQVQAEDSFRFVFAKSQIIGWGVTVAGVVGAALLVRRKRRRQREAMAE